MVKNAHSKIHSGQRGWQNLFYTSWDILINVGYIKNCLSLIFMYFDALKNWKCLIFSIFGRKRAPLRKLGKTRVCNIVCYNSLKVHFWQECFQKTSSLGIKVNCDVTSHLLSGILANIIHIFLPKKFIKTKLCLDGVNKLKHKIFVLVPKMAGLLKSFLSLVLYYFEENTKVSFISIN